MRYRPGLISGGRALSHDCGTARGLGYFLEPLLCLALFGKKVGERCGESPEREREAPCAQWRESL
jgi:hypothetical protein